MSASGYDRTVEDTSGVICGQRLAGILIETSYRQSERGGDKLSDKVKISQNGAKLPHQDLQKPIINDRARMLQSDQSSVLIPAFEILAVLIRGNLSNFHNSISTRYISNGLGDSIKPERDKDDGEIYDFENKDQQVFESKQQFDELESLIKSKGKDRDYMNKLKIELMMLDEDSLTKIGQVLTEDEVTMATTVFENEGLALVTLLRFGGNGRRKSALKKQGYGQWRTPHLEDGGDGGAAEDRARLCEFFDRLWKPGGQG
ncbi:hypothetical protein PPACK8108_LOCUS22221 [Phakopsora pachyrhizi]|uniref:Uncharacterized protein n=1 Tax=Phakopsora pachyrhizi TaxID=170000 RepID=A0AAV0BJL8_PHAPC|nr:hypothetical protein PPACK8108_LOCUS22221 [Phakopsora pachyrhizi]